MSNTEPKAIIAPSILSADFAKLGIEVKNIEKAGADIIHIDIMDGHFVPNITIGPAIVKAIRKFSKLPFDCHLMINEPEKYIKAFAIAGADMISVHIENSDPESLLPQIKKLGCKAGLVINPPTAIEKIVPYARYADYILVMTVNPGFGGQKMIEGSLEKIKFLKDLREQKNLKYLIQVDGGITIENIKKVSDFGCDIFVAGSAIFGKKNYKSVIDQMKEIVTT